LTSISSILPRLELSKNEVDFHDIRNVNQSCGVRISANNSRKTSKYTNRSLYRRSLKLSLDWAVHRHVWRGQAVYIRSLFEANKDVRDPRQQKVSPNEPSMLSPPLIPLLLGIVERDRRIAGKLETSRPLSRAYRSWRLVKSLFQHLIQLRLTPIQDLNMREISLFVHYHVCQTNKQLKPKTI
jgi:Complex 1 protein (LYR family)